MEVRPRHHQPPRGGVKKKLTKATYICRSPPQKSSYLLIFIFIVFIDFLSRFRAFRKKGVSKTQQKLFFTKAHLASGLITKNMFFFPLCFFLSPSVVLLDFLNRVFGRFVTRGVQKRDKQNHGKFSAAAKKVLTYLRHLFLPTPPLVAKQRTRALFLFIFIHPRSFYRVFARFSAK
jgi:hypothetical protein